MSPKYRPPWDVVANMAAEKTPLPENLNSKGRSSSRIKIWGSRGSRWVMIQS